MCRHCIFAGLLDVYSNSNMKCFYFIDEDVKIKE